MYTKLRREIRVIRWTAPSPDAGIWPSPPTGATSFYGATVCGTGRALSSPRGEGDCADSIQAGLAGILPVRPLRGGEPVLSLNLMKGLVVGYGSAGTIVG